MTTNECKVGLRVRHAFLGGGRIDSNEFACVGLVMVRWDRDPPAKYNCKANPSAVHVADLVVEDSND